MNDPHVDSLQYRFKAPDPYDYSAASPWEGRLGDFAVRLADSVLLATPSVHFTSEEEARAALEPHLHSWKLRSDLDGGITIEFEFDQSSIRDRQPIPGDANVYVKTVVAVAVVPEVTLKVSPGKYPEPPGVALVEDTLVTDLRASIHKIRSDNKRLLIDGYLFLTRLEYDYNKDRAKAAAAAAVSKPVLDRLGALTAVNDPSLRRKVEGPEHALTDAERKWIDAALRRITLQVAEKAGGGSPTRLTMGDLPPLQRTAEG